MTFPLGSGYDWTKYYYSKNILFCQYARVLVVKNQIFVLETQNQVLTLSRQSKTKLLPKLPHAKNHERQTTVAAELPLVGPKHSCLVMCFGLCPRE